MILCSYEKCRTIAKYFREGFGLRVFFCDEHKNNQCFGDSALKAVAKKRELETTVCKMRVVKVRRTIEEVS